MTPCPTVCTRNTSSMQEQQHLSSVGGCVGCWRCLGRCCLTATLPTWDLTSFPLRERSGNPEIQKTKLNSHCLLTTINLLSSACARRSLCPKHRLSFWRGKEANPDLVSGWKAARKCFGAASSPLAGIWQLLQPGFVSVLRLCIASSCRFAGFSKYCQRKSYIFCVYAYEARTELASFDEV